MFLLLILSAVALVALILLQRGKGADMGAAFGAGASGTLFGSVGSLPFLTKLTVAVAAVFFGSCLGLGYIIAKEVSVKPASVLSALPTSEQQQQQPLTTSSAIPIVPSSAVVLPQQQPKAQVTKAKTKAKKKTVHNHN